MLFADAPRVEWIPEPPSWTAPFKVCPTISPCSRRTSSSTGASGGKLLCARSRMNQRNRQKAVQSAWWEGSKRLGLSGRKQAGKCEDLAKAFREVGADLWHLVSAMPVEPESGVYPLSDSTEQQGAKTDKRPNPASREVPAGPPEGRLAQFMRENSGTTYADIKYSSRFHTAEFQAWRKGKLKPPRPKPVFPLFFTGARPRHPERRKTTEMTQMTQSNNPNPTPSITITTTSPPMSFRPIGTSPPWSRPPATPSCWARISPTRTSFRTGSRAADFIARRASPRPIGSGHFCR